MEAAEHQKSADEINTVNKSVADASDSQSQAQEGGEQEEQVVLNNHDLIGVDGIIKN